MNKMKSLMKKIVVLVFVLLCSLSAFSQIRISVSEISLMSSGKEMFVSNDMAISFRYTRPYIKIAADVYNDSAEPFDIKSRVDFVEIEYKYKGVTHISKCDIQNPFYGWGSLLSIPPQSGIKLCLIWYDGLRSDDYISMLMEIFPTVTVRFADDEMNKLIEASEPIEFHSLSVRSAIPE